MLLTGGMKACDIGLNCNDRGSTWLPANVHNFIFAKISLAYSVVDCERMLKITLKEKPNV